MGLKAEFEPFNGPSHCASDYYDAYRIDHVDGMNQLTNLKNSVLFTITECEVWALEEEQ